MSALALVALPYAAIGALLIPGGFSRVMREFASVVAIRSAIGWRVACRIVALLRYRRFCLLHRVATTAGARTGRIPARVVLGKRWGEEVEVRNDSNDAQFTSSDRV